MHITQSKPVFRTIKVSNVLLMVRLHIHMAPHLYLQNNYDAWKDLSYCLSVFFMSAYNVPIFNLRLRGTGKTNGNLEQLMTGIRLGINLVARRSACIDLGLCIGE